MTTLRQPVYRRRPFWLVAVFVTLLIGCVVAFAVWAMQTEQQIIQYERNETGGVNSALRKGWHIEHTEITKRKIGAYENPVTVVTLERSNWSKMWND